ncbi:MAG TPA: CoA transferase, partial [Stellaceae bacterium]|nr:CoA transferase [Stellaceae bacterium]
FAAEAPLPRAGNAGAPYALQDCVRGADGWLALSVGPEQLAALDRLIGEDGDAAGRMAALERWSGARPVAESVRALTSRGIAAAPVLDGRGMLAARGRLWSRAIADNDGYGLLKGFPFQLDGAPLRIERDAPEVGADTAAVLAEVGGYSASEIDALISSGAAETASG